MLTRFIFLLILTTSPLFSCQVIYLNGTSSVGKTTIAKAVQEEMEQPYLRIGIDQMIDLMPAKVNNWQGGKADLGFSWESKTDENGNPLQILCMGPLAKQMSGLLRDIVVAMVRNGQYVIIDDINYEGQDVWKNALKDFDVLWVGITASIEIIEEREKARGDRQVGQARAAAPIVHKGFTYDLFLDSSKEPTAQIVQKIKQACKKC